MIKLIQILRINNGISKYIEDSIINEVNIKIIINGKIFANLICSPQNINELVYGYLFTSGVIQSKSEVLEVIIYGTEANVILTNPKKIKQMILKNQISDSSDGNNILIDVHENHFTPKDFISHNSISIEMILENMKNFQNMSEVFQSTGGVHSVALLKKDNLVFSEDIGRHNAVDKVIGSFLLNNDNFQNTAIMLSGRVSSEILHKIIKAKIPIIISRSAPTYQVVEKCRELGITLIGFVRGPKMNVYSGEDRIILD